MEQINNLPAYLYLGNYQDFGHEVKVDLSAWNIYALDRYAIRYVRAGETQPHPIAGEYFSVVDGILTWTISQTVTDKVGRGSIIFEGYVGNSMAVHSNSCYTAVGPGLPADEDAPTPIQDWIADATQKLAEVDHFVDDTIEAAEAANVAAGLTTDAIARANEISETLEGIAPKWAAVDISASGLAAGADPTASVTQDVGGTHLTVGIPKGDKGDKGDTGNVMYATFDIDFDTGELVMTIPDGYTGPTFSINNETGELEVSI